MPRIGGQSIPSRTVFLITTECLLVVLSLMFAVLLRFLSVWNSWYYLHEPRKLWNFSIIVVVCGFTFYYNDLYDLQVVKHPVEFLTRLLQSLAISSFVLAILYYFAQSFSPGRGIVVIAAPLILVLILGWRTLLGHTQFLAQKPERLLVMGTGSIGISLVREILKRPEFNLKVVGFLDEKGENIGKSLVNPGIIGATADVQTIVSSEKIDRVVLSFAERRQRMPLRDLLQLKFRGIKVDDPHTVFERITGRIHLEHLNPSWFILSDGFRKSAFLMSAKRFVDITIAAVGLVLAGPIMLLVALAILIESGRPVIFQQSRIGMLGKEFRILKFRSMRKNAEEGGPAWATTGDSRITPVGRFIRKMRLDEFPQLINVLRGDMSLVGPRPEQPYFCALLEEQVPFFAQRHTVRPGVTGWAQIKYQYGASVEDAIRKLELDLFYIKHLSVTLDMVIIFETFKVMLLRRGAQ
jgi:sugar transferase (PEP-CTERM system associated)